MSHFKLSSCSNLHMMAFDNQMMFSQEGCQVDALSVSAFFDFTNYFRRQFQKQFGKMPNEFQKEFKTRRSNFAIVGLSML